MCFVNDADWDAQVYDAGTVTAEKPSRCYECHALIPIGGTVHTLDMQQYEECHCCTEGECQCVKDEDGDCKGGCQCAEPEYGETYSWRCCHDCFRFLEAVKQAELEAGCREYESQPLLERMVEDIADAGPEEARKYFKKALRLYPDMKAYLGRLWKTMFGRNE